MRVSWIEQFLHLCDTLSFRDASEQLYLSQSSFSKHIASLEKYLGVTLVDRTTRSVRLTAKGEAFRDAALEFMAAFNTAVKDIQENRAVSGSLIIGGAIRIPLFSHVLNCLLLSMEDKYSGVRISVRDTEVQDYQPLLLQEGYDVIFSILDSNLIGSEFGTLEIGKVPIYAWLNEDSPLLSIEHLTCADIDGYSVRFLEPEKRQRYISRIMALVQDRGACIFEGKPANRSFSGNPNEIVGILPGFDAPLNTSLVARKIEDVENVSIGAIYLKSSTSEALPYFLSELSRIKGIAE